MKLGLTAKLFLAILATNVVIAIAVGVAERVSFDRGFREYMREREMQRLATLAEALVALWRAEGSFESLRGNEMRWRSFTRTADFGGLPPPPPRGDRPPGPPPPRFGDRPPPPPPREVPALLDAKKQPVVGRLDTGARPVLREVVVDGNTVGWIAGVPMREPFTGAEQRLAEQQATASWVIGGLALALAALVGLLLARGLIAPLKRLAGATHRIAAGDYKVRVADQRTDELGQLVADFNRLAQTLEANDAMRRQFLADVSHELRTPLAVLRGEMEALEDGIRTITPDRLRSLQAEVATLGKVVDDLYDLSLADVGALAYHKERIDLVPVVDAAVGAFGERFAARGIAIEADLARRPAMVVDADPQRLTQVLNNLFENCVRYTDAGGRVRVDVAAVDGRARVDVMDSAPGVPEDALPRLFERLYRLDTSRNRRSGGAGLGLALCRSIVSGHEGEIHARASPLGGVWIRVTLPLA